MTRATFECFVPAGMTAEEIVARIQQSNWMEGRPNLFARASVVRLTVEIPATLTVTPDPNWKPRSWEQAADTGGE